MAPSVIPPETGATFNDQNMQQGKLSHTESVLMIVQHPSMSVHTNYLVSIFLFILLLNLIKNGI
jgi:hypothetical protein